MPFEMSMYWVSFLVAPYYNVYPFELAAPLIVNIKDHDCFQLERAELMEDGLVVRLPSLQICEWRLGGCFVERSPCIIEVPESQRVQGLTTDTVSMSVFTMTSALGNASSCHRHPVTITLF